MPGRVDGRPDFARRVRDGPSVDDPSRPSVPFRACPCASASGVPPYRPQGRRPPASGTIRVRPGIPLFGFCAMTDRARETGGSGSPARLPIRPEVTMDPLPPRIRSGSAPPPFRFSPKQNIYILLIQRYFLYRIRGDYGRPVAGRRFRASFPRNRRGRTTLRSGCPLALWHVSGSVPRKSGGGSLVM